MNEIKLVPADIEVSHELPGEPVVTNAIPYKPEPPKLSEGQIKLLRKQHVTVKLPRVLACGHRLDLSRQPRQRNCEHCWFAWFQNHGEIVQQLDEMFNQAYGGELITRLQGIKFLHRWRQFMATVASWKAAESNE